MNARSCQSLESLAERMEKLGRNLATGVNMDMYETAYTKRLLAEAATLFTVAAALRSNINNRGGEGE